MPKFKINKTTICLMVACQFAIVNNASAVDGLTESDSLEFKTRSVFFDMEYDKDNANRKNNTFAQGVELNYQSGAIADWFKVGLSVYGVAKINATGDKDGSDNLQNTPNGIDDGFVQLAQAYIELLPVEGASVKVGYQKIKHMLISSNGSRAVPSTFRGINAAYQLDSLKLYGFAYDEWSSRSKDKFEGFKNSQGKEIDLIWGLGGQFKQGGFAADAEYLVSEDYLEKFGVRGSYTMPLFSGTSKLSAGYLSSQDNGELFVNNNGENDGSVWYVDGDYKIHAFSFGLAYSHTDDYWEKFNYAGDHGTNPLPTASPLGENLAFTGESVLLSRIGVDFGKLVGVLKGFSSKVSYADGSGIEANGYKPMNVDSYESFLAVDSRYSFPMFKGLSLRHLYVDFSDAPEMTADKTQHRVYLDYSYKF